MLGTHFYRQTAFSDDREAVYGFRLPLLTPQPDALSNTMNLQSAAEGGEVRGWWGGRGFMLRLQDVDAA